MRWLKKVTRVFERAESADPRLDLLARPGASCACCGEPLENLFSLAFIAPNVPLTEKDQHNNCAVQTEAGNILTPDFCRFSDDLFVRCVMNLPIRGRPETFLLGCWGSLSKESFQSYRDHFFADGSPPPLPAFSWIANHLPGVEPTMVACEMVFRPELRPELFVLDDTHPLYRIQTDGLSPQTLIGWLENMGHRPTG